MLFVLTAALGTADASDSSARGDLRRSAVSLPEHQRILSNASARMEILWIFDADFEDLTGDNAGWISEDRSGTLAIENYWHKDTIRINGFTHLGDSTWWCGKYDPCWRQPRGYGNDWYQILERSFPEVPALTSPGDSLVLSFDQRIAMENDYDYGYVDVRSSATNDTWYTVISVDNPGFAGTPGLSQDWDSVNPVMGGHLEVDLSDYSGQSLGLRFRFESDGAYSSQDSWDNPPHHSVLDGAWQLDNIKLVSWQPDSVLVFLDDCESPGDNGWVHDGTPARGQAGVTFWRGLYDTDIWTNRPFTCDEQSGWMYAAVDPLTSRMVDGEDAWLVSPAINIEGASKLVGQWDMWVDLPRPTEDVFDLSLASHDDMEYCDWFYGGMDPPGAWYGGPFWGTWTDDWDAYTGNAWFRLRWEVWNSDPPAPGAEHMGGIFINRQRVGIPTGDPGSTWSYSVWDRFFDIFKEQLAGGVMDSAVVNVGDADDIVSVTLVADNGFTQTSYSCRRQDIEGNLWNVPPPEIEMIPGAEIHYHFEAEDGASIMSVFPTGAPDVSFEFSILPINGSVSDPCVLLVDKHGRQVPGEQRDYSTASEDYFREALDILGFEYDVYDVEVPSGSTAQSNGPDTMGYKYYDTQVWFTSNTGEYTIRPFDKANLISWLGQSQGGKERNLLLTGNDIGVDMVGDTLGFAAEWLGVQYCEWSVGDTLPGLRDVAGGFDFMTFDDAECVLRGGCPEFALFDGIQPHYLATGAEVVAEYVKDDMSTRPAGVAYTGEFGHQAVTLGFGVECMSDALLPTGHFSSGASDRVDLMANIMEYFEKDPTGPGTGVDGSTFSNRLGHARPNPFNPATTIEFSLAAESRVTVRIFDCAGRVVRTFVDDELEAGPHTAIWNGTTDTGQSAASGVYFIRMEAAGSSGSFRANRKLVLLK